MSKKKTYGISSFLSFLKRHYFQTTKTVKITSNLHENKNKYLVPGPYLTVKMLSKCGTKDESEDHGLQATKINTKETRDPP